MTKRNDFAKDNPKEIAKGFSYIAKTDSEKIRKADLAHAFVYREDVNGYKTIASGEFDNVKGVKEATLNRDNSYTR